jgi:hypothetical protein
MLIRLAFLLSLAAVPAVGQADELDDLLGCNAEALGGAAAFEAIDNLRVELDISEPTFEVKGTYVASREGYMRIDIFAGEQRVFAEGLNAGGAWQWNPEGGVKATSAAGAAALRNGIEGPGRFWTLASLRERGLGVELLEPGALARPEERQLRLTRADGSTLDYLLARETCLPTREVSWRAYHPDVDPTEVQVETTFNEPVPVDGVLRFRRGESRTLDTGDWLGTTKVLSVEHNVDLAEDFFDGR